MTFAEAKRSQKQENSSNIYLDIYINCSLFFFSNINAVKFCIHIVRCYKIMELSFCKSCNRK